MSMGIKRAKTLVELGLAAVAGGVAFGLSPTAKAAGVPLGIDASFGGLESQGCSGLFGTLGQEFGQSFGLSASLGGFDSMLFQTSSGPCSSFQTFDVAFLAVVALIVISAIRFRHATAQRRLDLARRMVEKGIEPPADLLGNRGGSDLRRGLVLVSTGVGLVLASWFGGGGELSPAGLIPGFIGLGYLISHRFAGPQGGKQSPSQSQSPSQGESK